MKRVTVKVFNGKGKLVRTCQEYYYGGMVGGRDAMKQHACQTVAARFAKIGQVVTVQATY
jgi:hypothetical protein